MKKSILRILKEKVIVLTSYERKSLFRFLAVYLISVFILLAIIGHLFFENNRASMKSAMKFEMMYRGRMISSDIVMKAMTMPPDLKEFDLKSYLKKMDHCRFDVGYYDKNKRPIFTQIDNFKGFDKEFFEKDERCYNVVIDPSDHLGVHYIVLKENELSHALKELRIRIISYLIFWAVKPITIRRMGWHKMGPDTCISPVRPGHPIFR